MSYTTEKPMEASSSEEEWEDDTIYYIKGNDVWTDDGRRYKIIQVKRNEIMIENDCIIKLIHKKYTKIKN